MSPSTADAAPRVALSWSGTHPGSAVGGGKAKFAEQQLQLADRQYAHGHFPQSSAPCLVASAVDAPLLDVPSIALQRSRRRFNRYARGHSLKAFTDILRDLVFSG